MKKVLLSGYYGFGNTGDEALLAAIIEQLRAAIPGVKITALSNNPAETAAAYDVRAADRWRFWDVFRAIRKCDIFVSGGGSQLQDATSSKSLYYYLALMLLARMLRRRVFVYAQGVGPLNKKRGRRCAGFVLRRCHCITLRDEDSAQLLLSLGVPAEKLIVTADPVLAWPCDEPPPPLPVGRKMAFCLRPSPKLNIPGVAAAADRFAGEGWKIIFLPFSEESDLPVCRQAAAAMNRESFVLPGTTPSRMMAILGACEAVVGNRLHALVMAAAGAVPFLGLVSDPKISSFCAGLQQPALDLETLTEELLCEKIAEVISKSEESRQYFTERRPQWRRICRANAEMVRECAFGAQHLKLEYFLGETEQEAGE
ncbi:MAG: polysaccharide pyruvyl transferase CsaB [Clostridiales bacterium]|nr:polysaccharide pyruvyl transferase CsaB [Clostridiales bacterium]